MVRIEEIYSRYNIPENLKLHMLRVAAVGKLVVVNYKGVVDADLVVRTLLLHDMGNILKFDLSRDNLLMGTDRYRIEELSKIKAEYQDKYGPNCDAATLKIMEELGMENRIISLCESSHGSHLEQILNEDWVEPKICHYADMRVGPFGVMTVNDRFADLMKRYAHHKETIERNFGLTLELEKELQQKVGINLKDIDTDWVEEVKTEFNNFLI